MLKILILNITVILHNATFRREVVKIFPEKHNVLLIFLLIYMLARLKNVTSVAETHEKSQKVWYYLISWDFI